MIIASSDSKSAELSHCDSLGRKVGAGQGSPIDVLGFLGLEEGDEHSCAE